MHIIAGSATADAIMKNRLVLKVTNLDYPFAIFRENVIKWIYDNTSGYFYTDSDNTGSIPFVIGFAKDEDLVLFKLAFEGKEESELR